MYVHVSQINLGASAGRRGKGGGGVVCRREAVLYVW